MVKEIAVQTHNHTELIDITHKVQDAAASFGIDDGICVVYTPHTTAAITINEGADPDVTKDIVMELEKAVPWRDVDYRHGEGNSAAHIKSSMFGASETLLIENGKIIFGTWQSVYFCEFDGPRSRRVYVKVIGK